MDRRYMALVHSFPVLGGSLGGRPGLGPAPGVHADRIELEELDRWAAGDPEVFTRARGPFPGEGAKDAARFVLHVWSTTEPWRSGPFDLFRALRTWDQEQLAAFQAWIAAPFRP